MRSADSISAVAGILVGGRSTRMGRPKATLALPDGRTMIEQVVDAARRAGEWIHEVVLLGRCDDLPASLGGLRTLPDAVPAGGPLGGLCSLLEWAGGRLGLLLACDMPRLEASLLERLRAAAGPDWDAVAFRRTDRPDTWHACCALYHPRLLPAAGRELRQGRGSLQNLLAGARVAGLEPEGREQELLMNLNTPEAYDRFLRDAQSRRGTWEDHSPTPRG